MYEHIRWAHLQCHVWQHVLVANSPMLEPTTLGWSREANCELMPVCLTTGKMWMCHFFMQMSQHMTQIHQLIYIGIFVIFLVFSFCSYP